MAGKPRQARKARKLRLETGGERVRERKTFSHLNFSREKKEREKVSDFFSGIRDHGLKGNTQQKKKEKDEQEESQVKQCALKREKKKKLLLLLLPLLTLSHSQADKKKDCLNGRRLEDAALVVFFHP